jgi:geranylgeranyl diphosphate synthase type II
MTEHAPHGRELAYPEHLRELVDDYLADLHFGLGGPTDRLSEAMRYSLLAGGKRIRPVLTLSVVESLGRPPRPALPTAAALELIHTYSLIHDDLPAIDNDDLRRGKATCHVAFGEDVAILAGDALYAEAISLVVEHQVAPPAVLVAVLGEIARATGVRGMVGGQYIDVTSADTAQVDLRQMHALKTGALIEAAVVSGALLGGRKGDELPPYRAFAAELGLLFQIVDDILDAVGSDEQLGKTPGKDVQSGKVTYVSRFGVARARELAQEALARAQARLIELPGETTGLRAVTAYIGGRER